MIVAHGGLGEELLAATIHVVGPQPGAMAIATRPDDDLSEKQAEIDAAIAAVDEGDGVIVVTDMFGGTPCNLSIGAMREDKVEIVYGANLPMLVKLAKCRKKNLAEAAQCAVAAGIKYIDCASNMLKPSK